MKIISEGFLLRRGVPRGLEKCWLDIQKIQFLVRIGIIVICSIHAVISTYLGGLAFGLCVNVTFSFLIFRIGWYAVKDLLEDITKGDFESNPIDTY